MKVCLFFQMKHDGDFCWVPLYAGTSGRPSFPIFFSFSKITACPTDVALHAKQSETLRCSNQVWLHLLLIYWAWKTYAIKTAVKQEGNLTAVNNTGLSLSSVPLLMPFTEYYQLCFACNTGLLLLIGNICFRSKGQGTHTSCRQALLILVLCSKF